MLRFIVNVWTFTINTKLVKIVLFFGPYDTSNMKPSFHFRFALPLLKDQTKWTVLKYESLTCPNDYIGASD